MKKILLEMLICPRCLPEENLLKETIFHGLRDQIIEGTLECRRCNSVYPIDRGVAFLDPNGSDVSMKPNRYETPPLLSSYLWSHYGDLLEDEHATDAYLRWAEVMKSGSGLCIDTGSAVGRFSFEMAKKFDFVVGIDNSVSFIRASRDLSINRQASLALQEEGTLKRHETLIFPEAWRTDNTEFIVGDAQVLPFRSGIFSALSSLNIVDKVSKPMVHLGEINRVARTKDVQFLFSDPFSWSTEVAPVEEWLGGKHNGRFSGMGKDNIIALLEGKIGAFSPAWKVDDEGHIWWKIRTHRNHFELIRSCFIKASR
ncbi:MAG: methyltransferase domain-containing protein [Deltaproteobacteria bacterium]|nr:methyltransferase domain-containing protein [Deltaproteobacteria bacterium]